MLNGSTGEEDGVTVAEPMTRRDHHAETTRRDVLAAGREISSQHPYSEVSGLEICNHAGVTRGALRDHFGSKLGYSWPFLKAYNTPSLRE
jgi:hypothetical protein